MIKKENFVCYIFQILFFYLQLIIKASIRFLSKIL